ncbi:hypothetical protein O0L34_g14632 [Tuta absoluta]|nr:hypothetical protein O0L34_g14632 [Tuta absoluta]
MAVVIAETEPSTAAAEFDPPYCALRYRRLCQGKGQHVACQFPDGWDRELALLAQRLADQCSFVHDDCRATVRFPYAGQSVGEIKWHRTSQAKARASRQDVARAIRRVLDAWWSERRRVTARQLTQPFRLTNKGNVWGHFSQLAVWSLRAVGCGAAKHGVHYPKLLLVCDFSHTNMLGQRTIVPGPLGPCPIHTARRPRSPYPTLCATVRYQDEEEDPKSNNHNPIAHEIHNKDENHENYDHYEDVDNTNELDDIISYTNATRAPKPTEHKKVKEIHTPNSRKRLRVNTWRETDNQESGRNDIFRHEDIIKIKDKIHDKTIARDDYSERSEYINKHKDINERPRNRVTPIQVEDAISESCIDGISNDENTGVNRVKGYRGKSREKVEEHETENINTRYQIPIGDIQKQRKFAMNIDNGGFVRGFHKNQENYGDNSTIGQAQEYQNNHRENYTPSKQRYQNYGPNKFRLLKDWREQGTSPSMEGSRAETVSGAPDMFYEPVGLRHRWRPTKDRPVRPGAKVLKTNTYIDYTTTRPPAAKKNSINFASILMDKDDVEQLFKDTGFNIGWRRYKTKGG